jgi:hypothetical protein
MKQLSAATALLSIALFVACCSKKTTTQADADLPTASVTTANSNGGISSAHGGGGGVKQNAPSGAAPSLTTPENIDTSAYDAKIAKAEAKVKSGGSDADKRALAAAYVERGNVFYNAGVPMLYKFALRDFRLALKYQPDNAEAKEKRDMIVSIYQSMNRPVPDLGNEP